MGVFEKEIAKIIDQVTKDTLSSKNGIYLDKSLFNGFDIMEDGVSVFITQDRADSSLVKTRNIISTTPEAVVLIKKKAFSTLKGNNDLQWMDKTEKMLLRATKALFAYKVAQLRAYESLAKVKQFMEDYNELNLLFFADFLYNAQFLTIPQSTHREQIDSLTSDYTATYGPSSGWSEVQRESFQNELMGISSSVSDDWGKHTNVSPSHALSLIVGAASKQLSDINFAKLSEGHLSDVYAVLKRSAFSNDSFLTRWIVDPSSTDNFTTGPGTGVIELTMFSSFNTNCSCDSPRPGSASVQIEDPYRISNITSDDIEIAIDEALFGTVGILDDLANGNPAMPLADGASIASAAFEIMGLGGLDGSLDMDYVRDRLRTFYLGKPFVNTADGIHIFARSNRYTQDYSNNGSNMNPSSIMDEREFAIDEAILEAERKMYTDQKIPFDMYVKLRNTNSLSMMHIFGGLVVSTSQSYSQGTHTLSINCSDSMEWLNWSRFIGQPAMQDPQGILEDPVTPFEININEMGAVDTTKTPELLYENKYLLGSGLLSYDNGVLNGKVASEHSLTQGQYNLGGSLKGARQIQHASGMIYRWKTGIITATAGLTSSDPLFSDWNTIKEYGEAYGLNIAEDTLNNLDVANILSILIVGQPYNIESFMKQAFEVQSIGNDSNTTLSAMDPLFSVLNATRKQNLKFGNFRPYRMITMSSLSTEQATSNTLGRINSNSNIEALQRRKAEIRTLIKNLRPVDWEPGTDTPLVLSLQSELASIDAGIAVQVASVKMQNSMAGEDIITQAFNLLGKVQTLAHSGDFEADHQISRAMTLVGAQRRIEDVRLNNDMNLFIVSDQYDANTDIRSYIFALKKSKWNIFNGEFYSTYQKCADASKFLNLEFFCNSQGSLEFRPPLWNRTPLSVLKEQIEISKKKGIKVLPGFLEELFETRIDSIKRDIHAVNIKIALISLLLGSFPDGNLMPGLKSKVSGGANSLKFFGITATRQGSTAVGSLNIPGQSGVGGALNAISNALTGSNSIIDSSFNISKTGDSSGDILDGNTTTLIGDFDPIAQEASGSSIIEKLFPQSAENIGPENFTVAVGTNNPIMQTQGTAVLIYEVANKSFVNKIREDFRNNFGVDPLHEIAAGRDIDAADFVRAFSRKAQENLEVNSSIDSDSIKQTKTFDLLKKLQVAVSQRDTYVSTLQRNIEKEQELKEVARILETGDEDEFADLQDGPIKGKAVDVLKGVYEGVKFVNDILSGDANKGSVYDHLIIDDERNLLGPGSGKRFVIRDESILRSDFSEVPPEFTRVDVYGDAPIYGDAWRKTFENVAFWAGATDFDLWRQYGYKGPKSTNLPFASNAELQCRPFAIMELQMQRVKINTGNLEVVGNEYYQPGDTVYVPYKGLLYYVTSVRHSFRWGGSFTTTLSLTNGHPPGKYLPSPLDIIGQQFTGNPLYENYLVHRDSAGDDKYTALQPDCTIVFPMSPQITEDNISTLLDHNGNQQRYYNMMLDLNTSGICSSSTKKVLIRGFITSEMQEDIVNDRLDIVKELLINPVRLQQSVPTAGGDDLIDGIMQIGRSLNIGGDSTKDLSTMILPNGSEAVPVPEENIIIQLVNIGEKRSRKGKDGSFEHKIRCANKSIYNTFVTDVNQQGEVEGISDLVFPSGGPKQASWLYAREAIMLGNSDALTQVIEVGVLDI